MESAKHSSSELVSTFEYKDVDTTEVTHLGVTLQV